MLLEKLKCWLTSMGNFYFPKKNPKHNIGLYGDGDDIEIIEDVEKKFSIKISDSDGKNIRNIGEFYTVLLDKSKETGAEISWDEFLKAIASHSRLPTYEIRKETEFYRYIKRWEN